MSDTTNEVVVEQPELKFQRLKFSGESMEYFKIWIVNILLSIVTLGIYSAWGKIRLRKYIYASTSFRGHTFDYHAKPIPILKGRALAAVIFGIYFFGSNFVPLLGPIGFILFLLALPFFFIKSIKFNFANTSFNNVRFFCSANLKDTYKIYFKYIWPPILANIIITGLYLSFGYDNIHANSNDPVAIAVPLMIIGLINIFTFAYYVYILPSMLDLIFKTIYNNLYYGGVKVNIKSNKERVSLNITKPYYKEIGIAFLKALGLAAVAFALIMTIPPLGSFLMAIAVILGYVLVLIASVRFPYLLFMYVWKSLSCDLGEITTDLKWKDFKNRAITNMFAVGLTFGLLYPWSKVEMLRLKINSRALKVGDLDNISDIARERESAIAEEIGDAFDFDFDIGL